MNNRPQSDVGPLSEDRAHSCELSIGELIERRLSRRDALRTFAVTASTVAASVLLPDSAAAQAAVNPLGFEEVSHGYDARMHVPPGYTGQVVIRWGDPVERGAAVFDPDRQTADKQEKQFGYNNDFVAFMPLRVDGSKPTGGEQAPELSKRGLLCVNHEYTILHLMFSDVREDSATEKKTREQAEVELAAHGHSVVEIERTAEGWKPVADSRYNRRISARSTWMTISGPAAGHERLRTADDPTGKRVLGTLNNCAGGVTPWGTVLTAEENFNAYFAGQAPPAESTNSNRYGIKQESVYAWNRFFDRFDIAKEPREPNRFGWIVEYDPYDPLSVPVKRTALGRCKHEGATVVKSADGRAVVYSGDDQMFDYLYRFVSAKPVEASNPAANRNLLDEGILSVARFSDDGTLEWLPLVHGQGPLIADRGFKSQADVLIETRRAADLLGATPMDRPEDVETSPVTGRVYVMLTNNVERSTTTPANPRKQNAHGHVLELIPPGSGSGTDHAATRYQWNVLLLAGNPRHEPDRAAYHADVSPHGWLSCPDNCAIDLAGRLWITTDGAPERAAVADGAYVCELTGPMRALTRHFFRAPRGAEVCGPAFTPDGKTLFLAIQHPADDDGSDFNNPSTRWPDFDPTMPPRPSVIAIRRDDDQPIGR